MAWGGGLHGNAVFFEEAGPGFSGVFRGARVASNMTNMVAVGFVERDDFVGGGEETSGGFVFDEYGVSISAEEVFEEEESVVASYGYGADRTLVVDA